MSQMMAIIIECFIMRYFFGSYTFVFIIYLLLSSEYNYQIQQQFFLYENSFFEPRNSFSLNFETLKTTL